MKCKFQKFLFLSFLEIYPSIEEIYFLDKVSAKFLTRATAILDYDNNKIIKTRIEGLTPEKMLSHVQEKYPDQFLQFMKVISEDKKDSG